MPFLTLFTSPKPFTDPHIATIQRNAIRSWTHLGPDVDVLLVGEEDGLAETAAEFGVTHLPAVKRNRWGTPLVSSIFDLARQNSASPVLAYLNADILVMPDFVDAARAVAAQAQEFLIIGRRWDLEVRRELDFDPDWVARLRADVDARGRLHGLAGSDYFVFPRQLYSDMPDFAIGRAGWDNWMIYKARREKWTVIDCTPSVMIVHQNHDYSHLPGGKPHYEHPDTNENIRLAGGEANIRYTVLDATHQLAPGGKLVRPRMSYLRFMRGVELFLRKVFFFLPEKMIENVARPKRWKKRIQKIFRKR